MQNPYFERLPISPDSSLATLSRHLDLAIPFKWHHHPEYELTLTLNSKGQRFIGDHVGKYDHGDLVLIGPNLPHSWSSQAKIDGELPHIALVIWFRQKWIDEITGSSVEFAAIRNLFDKSVSGLAFGAETGCSLIPRFETVFSSDPASRLIIVLEILLHLATRENAHSLSSVTPIATSKSHSRIDRVLHYLHQNYACRIQMSELAELAALSESGLCRMFTKHTNMTVTNYIMQLRIGDACARLAGTDQPVAHIAEETGYNNLANFNRQFRAITGMTPREYRASFKIRL